MKLAVSLSILVLILILVALYLQFRQNEPPAWSAQNSGFSPAERYPDVVAEFGQPDAIDKSVGGGAVWFEPTLKALNKPWTMVMMIDEAIPHKKPAPHADFLYSWFRINIPDQKTMYDILKLSESVSYDQLKKVLQVRCHFMGANKATAVLAIRMAQGKQTLEQIQKNNLYAKFVFRTVEGHKMYDPNAEAEYEKEILAYVNSL